MRKSKALSLALGVVFAPAILVSAAHAVPTTYVSKTNGNDGNVGAGVPCNISQPCLTIAAAQGVTDAGGAIVLMGNAVWEENVTINTALTISGEGAIRGSGSGPVVTINASAPGNERVTFRNIAIVGQSSNSAVIRFNTGRGLNIENVRIQGSSGAGVDFLPTAAGAPGASIQLYMNDVQVNQTGAGVTIKPTGSGIETAAVLRDVRVRHSNSWGLRLDGSGQAAGPFVRADVIDSVFFAHSTNGIIVQSDTGQARTQLMSDGVHAYNIQNYGLVAVGTQAFVFINRSTFAQCGTAGVGQLNGSTIGSYGTNSVNFNGVQVQGTITNVPYR